MTVYFWIALSVVVAVAAHTRGRDPGNWFIGAILFSPLVMGLMLLVLPEFPIGRIRLERHVSP
jgi:hypothetical protein